MTADRKKEHMTFSRQHQRCNLNIFMKTTEVPTSSVKIMQKKFH